MSSSAYTPAEPAKPTKCRSLSTSFILLLLSGVSIGFIALGYWLHVYKPDEMAILGKAVNEGVAYGLIAAGAILLGATLIGFLGMCCQKRCLVLFALILMVFVLLFGIACGSYIAHFNGNTTETLTLYLEESLRSEYGMEQVYTDAWDSLQTNKTCCGVISSSDYKATEWYSSTNNTNPKREVPSSCCRLTTSGSIGDSTKCQNGSPDAVHGEGCLDIMDADFKTWMKYGVIGAFTLCGLLLLALIIVGCYICSYNQTGTVM